jgi:hypothetical protein
MTYKKVLGLDVSSTTIGYGLLNVDLEKSTIDYVHSGFIKPNKTEDFIKDLADTRDEIKVLIDKYQPDYIGIENLIKFMKGASSADTIIKLTSFNRMISLVAYDYLKRSPELFNVMSIRHGLKLTKVLPKKEELPELLEKHLNFKFPFTLSKKGKIQEESYDESDGVCVSLYYSMKLTNKLKTKSKGKKTK